MTLEVPQAEAAQVKERSCAFCLRSIGDEFHFSCLACGSTYCYIHMSRHASCRARRRASRRMEAVQVPAHHSRRSSANV